MNHEPSSMTPPAADWTWASDVSAGALVALGDWLKTDDGASAPRATIRNVLEEHSRLRTILGHCPKPIAVLDETGRIAGFNQEFRSMFGPTPDLGSPMIDLFEGSDRKLLDEVIRNAGTRQRAAAIVVPKHEDGAPRRISLLAATVPSSGARSIGVVLAGEDRSAPAAVDDEDVGFSIEKANCRAVFDLAQATLRHDVANAISAALLGMRARTGPRAKPIDEATDALEHALQLIGAARSIPSAPSTPQRTSVWASATSAVRLAGTLRGLHTDVRIEVDESIDVSMTPTALTQMLTNLLRNALHAETKANHVVLRAERTDGRSVATLSVTDDGIGIEPGSLAAAFEPRTTSHGSDEHRGLGLAIVRRLAEESFGRVSILSKPMRGTKVVIELPLADVSKRA